jgi:transposase
MDETALTQEPYLCKTWSKRGIQAQVKAPAGLRWTLHIFGAINLMDSTICYTLAEKRTSDSFIAWLERLMTVTYPTQNVCVVLDNASFHRSAISQAAADLFAPRLKLVFLPPHSPELNPIEPYWSHLKRRVAGNHLCAALTETETRALIHLNHQNQTKALDRYVICT